MKDILELFDIRNENAIISMNSIKDNIVDAVVTDFPYGISEKGKLTKRKGEAVRTLGEWDIIKNRHLFNFAIFYQLFRILKNGGIIYANMDRKDCGFYGTLLPMLSESKFDDKITLFNIYYMVKRSPVPHYYEINFRSGIEEALILIKGTEPKTFHFLDQSLMKNYELYNNTFHLTDHPTEKPLRIIRRIIAIFTNPRDIIYDPFLGSGQTAIACRQLGRICWGCEAKKEYYDMTISRLKDIRVGLEKFL